MSVEQEAKVYLGKGFINLDGAVKYITSLLGTELTEYEEDNLMEGSFLTPSGFPLDSCQECSWTGKGFYIGRDITDELSLATIDIEKKGLSSFMPEKDIDIHFFVQYY